MTMAHHQILLIEDDSNLGATLSENLGLDGFHLHWEQNAEGGLLALTQKSFDLVILDRMLPSMDGLEALRRIRQSSSVPVLMISARGSAQDRIEGLQALADDYLPKPFHLKEFRLRIDSLLRRTQKTIDETFTLNTLRFDLRGLQAQRQDGTIEKLSPKEASLIRALRLAQGAPVSREDLVQALWSNDGNSNTRTIDNLIVKIRKLIADDPVEPKYFISHRGVGYSLRME